MDRLGLLHGGSISTKSVFFFLSYLLSKLDLCSSDTSNILPTISTDIQSVQFSSVQSLSRVRFFATPTPGLPVHHQLLKSTQTHVHWVGDAIQPSYPLSSPSPPALHLSQHQGLFQWVSSSHQVAKVLEFQLQHQSFQWTPRLISFRMDWLDLLAVQGILKSLLQHFSSKHQFFSLQSSL